MLSLAAVKLHKLLGDESGAGILEYGLLVLLIALVAVVSIQLFGNATGDIYSDIASTVRN